MARNQSQLERPLGRRSFFRLPYLSQETVGRISERFWLTWNTLAPNGSQFDPRALNFTLLTLILSLQASYAAPLILLAQNRQDAPRNPNER